VSGLDGKPLSPAAAAAAERRDTYATLTRCSFCDWNHEGTAVEGRQLAADHRRAHHPDVGFSPRSKRFR